MTLTATFDDPTGKVTLSVIAAPAGASAAHFQRSVDQVTWVDVRGGQAAPVAGGVATFLDYEYTAGQLNYYRVTYTGTAGGSFVAHGAAATGNNTPLTPALPAGIAVGDLKVLAAAIRSAPTTGQITTPAGWTPVARTPSGFNLFTRIHQAGDVAPTVTFTGGAAGDDTLAEIAAFRTVGSSTLNVALSTTVATQNVPYPATAPATDGMVLLTTWKQDDNTSVATPAGFTALDNINSTAGNDASLAWFYRVGVLAGTVIPSGSVVVTGGTAAVSIAHMTAISSSVETATVTPGQTAIWLKNPLRPFLNRTVRLVGPLDDVSRDDRSGLFDIIGATLPVAVTDLMSGLITSYTIDTRTRAEVVSLDLFIAVGEVLLFQPPGASNLETLYAVPGSPTRTIFTENNPRRFTNLPLSECAMPDLTVAATQSTFQTVNNTYASFADLLAAKATFGDVLLLVGTAADVITS